MSQAARLADASRVVYGPEGSRAWRDLMYALYVITLLGGIYFFTTARAVIITVAAWWSGIDGWVWWVIAAAVAAVLVLPAYRTGRRIGPVTAPLAWVDLVVASPLDRSLTLREHWAIKVAALTGGGLLIGALAGGALWSGGATGWPGVFLGPLLGAFYGWLTATAWFAGQLSTQPRPTPGMPPDGRFAVPGPRAMRRLSLHGVRTHSRSALLFAGALHLGDLRMAQLEVATPVSRGRDLRLRRRGPVATVVARDWLGLRRQPFLLLTGAGLATLGWVALGYTMTEGSPWPLTVLALMLAHLGCHRTGDGLRLFGDIRAAPVLLGMAPLRQAVAHSVVPGALTLVAGLPGSVLLAIRSGAPGTLVRYALSLMGVTMISLAVQWIDGLRVRTPTLVNLSEQGPIILALSWLWPVALATGAGYLITTRAATFVLGNDPPSLLAVPALVTLLLGVMARRTVSR